MFFVQLVASSLSSQIKIYAWVYICAYIKDAGIGEGRGSAQGVQEVKEEARGLMQLKNLLDTSFCFFACSLCSIYFLSLFEMYGVVIVLYDQ